jgi:hypothetical protein
MNRPNKPRAPRETKEELVPRGSRQDPRADPITSPPPPMSQAPLSSPPHGRDELGAERAGAMLEANLLAERVSELERQLEERARTEAALRDTAVVQIRRIAALEHENRQQEQRVRELRRLLAEAEGVAKERAAHADRVAELERQIDELRRHTEEIEALRESVDRAGQENAALEEALLYERAATEQLRRRVICLEALLEKVKILLP